MVEAMVVQLLVAEVCFFFLCELILFVHEYGCYKNQFLGGWSGEGGGRGLGESSNSGGWSGQGKF